MLPMTITSREMDRTRPLVQRIKVVDGRDHEDMLVSSAKAGDTSSFAELISMRYGRLLRTVYRITGNWEDAEDALQFAQMKAFEGIRAFDGRSMFSTWYTRIAINAALGVLRKRKSRRETTVELDWHEAKESNCLSISDRRWCPEALYEDREREARYKIAVGHLKPLLRGAWDLHYTDQLTIKEIAAHLGISDAAVKSRLLRARTTVRHKIGVCHHG
jgi:RNA polymerase sigma-70 factor (ECF subfamily)